MKIYCSAFTKVEKTLVDCQLTAHSLLRSCIYKSEEAIENFIKVIFVAKE
jgi:hypothetical protein